MSRMRVGVAVAVVLAVAATTWVLTKRDDTRDLAPHEQTMKYGYGRVLVEVPASWGINEFDNCGTPTRDSVLFGSGPANLCASYFPRNTSAVSVYSGHMSSPEKDYANVQVDGINALRLPTRCGPNRSANFETCSAELVFPEEAVSFWVETSVEDAEAAVERILSRVHLYDDLVGVPDEDFREDVPNNHSSAAYVRKLQRFGLTAKVVTRPWQRDTSAGDLVLVSPGQGRAVAKGGTVTVTVGEAPRGPAGEVLLKMTLNEGSKAVQTFFDRDLRDRSYGTQVRLGTTFLPTFTGARARDARVEVVGESIALADRRGGRVLTAVRPGKSILSFVLDDGDSEIYLGRLVVVVQKELPYPEP